MNLNPTLTGTLAYTVVTFPLAVTWHVALFKQTYHSFGYFEGEPSFVLGLTTIVIQGFILSLLFPRFNFTGSPTTRGVKYALMMGIFFWTSHVLAFVAKQNVEQEIVFIAMESVYLLFQFGIFGVLLGLIFKNHSDKKVNDV